MATYTIAELRSISDAELIDIYDQKAKHTDVGTKFYLDELSRRAQDRQTEQMLRYTRSVKRMTWVITVATIINILIAGMSAYFSYQAVLPK